MWQRHEAGLISNPLRKLEPTLSKEQVLYFKTNYLLLVTQNLPQTIDNLVASIYNTKVVPRDLLNDAIISAFF